MFKFVKRGFIVAIVIWLSVVIAGANAANALGLPKPDRTMPVKIEFVDPIPTPTPFVDTEVDPNVEQRISDESAARRLGSAATIYSLDYSRRRVLLGRPAVKSFSILGATLTVRASAWRGVITISATSVKGSAKVDGDLWVTAPVGKPKVNKRKTQVTQSFVTRVYTAGVLATTSSTNITVLVIPRR